MTEETREQKRATGEGTGAQGSQSTLSCQDAMVRLWAYIDGELEPGSQQEMRRHLELCENCFPQYDFQRAYLEFLHRHARGDAPRELRRRVFRRLLEEGRASGGGGEP